MLSSLWVAYPLYKAATEGSYNGDSGDWRYFTSSDQYNETGYTIPAEKQVNIISHSYGVNVGSTTHEGYNDQSNLYARGHQIPNGDRKNYKSFNKQTYYAINSTPQIQNGFNSGPWNSLEESIRNAIPASDTLYIATGPAFQKIGEATEAVTWITPQDDNKSCPVPNYYWKVVLKVKRTGGKVTAAKAIGFWFKHDVYSNYTLTDFAVSVDQIEQWTGFDFFVNLPDSVETTAETNSSWSTFKNF